MRTFSYWIVAFFLFVALPGCGGNTAPQTDPTVNLSKSGKAAYQATRVIKVLDVVRDVAVAAEEQTPKLMSTDSTRKVVLYHQSLVKIITAAPEGWVTVARQTTLELQKQIPAEEWKQVDPFVRLLWMLLEEVK